MKSSILSLALLSGLGLCAAHSHAGLVASDDAADSAYDSGLSDGLNGGSGFGPWSITTGANSDSFTTTSLSNGFGAGPGIDAPYNGGRAWGLSASDADVASAVRPLDSSLQVGHTLRFAFDYGFAETGGVVGIALQNSTGEDLLEIAFTGGGNLDVTDGAGTSNSGLSFSTDGFEAQITLDSATTYSGRIVRLDDHSVATISGTLLAPAGGQDVDQVRFFTDNIAPPGSSGDPGWFFFFNDLEVDDNISGETVIAADDSSNAAYDSGFSDGLNGGTGFNPWNITTGANANAFLANSIANGFGEGPGVNAPYGQPGDAWGLASSDGSNATAARPFAAAMQPGQTIRFGFDYGFVETGAILGARIQNASGEDLILISFSGGGTGMFVTHGTDSTAIGLGYSSDGFEVEITLDTTTTFSGTITRLGNRTSEAISGTLFSPGGGQAIAQVAFFANNVAPSGMSGDQGWFYHFNNLEIVAPASSVGDWALFD
ncbi:MAG: hypothetical protein RLY93_04285 [Sumerlaeia bacterium]